MMLNKEALKRMSLASAAYGLTETCRNFDVSQDVGIEAYVWLFGVYHVWMPNVEINGNHLGLKVFRPKQLLVHGLKQNQEHCRHREEAKWPEEERYNQKVVIGCGDIGHKGPFHDSVRQASMYDAFEYFREHGEDAEYGKEGEYEWQKTKVTIYPRKSEGEKVKIKEILKGNERIENGKYNGDEVVELVIPRLQFIDGYEKTTHAKTHDIVNKAWAGFTLNDCAPPGKIDK